MKTITIPLEEYNELLKKAEEPKHSTDEIIERLKQDKEISLHMVKYVGFDHYVYTSNDINQTLASANEKQAQHIEVLTERLNDVTKFFGKHAMPKNKGEKPQNDFSITKFLKSITTKLRG